MYSVYIEIFKYSYIVSHPNPALDSSRNNQVVGT